MVKTPALVAGQVTLAYDVMVERIPSGIVVVKNAIGLGLMNDNVIDWLAIVIRGEINVSDRDPS